MEDKAHLEVHPITEALSTYISESQRAPIPDEFLELGRRHILDTLASIVACRDLEPSALARNYAISLSGDAKRNTATILGTSQTASLVDAVFASAMAGHGAEINDFIPSAFVQPGPSIVSASIALAENRGLSGEAVLRAVVTGYELAGRIPKALGIANLREANIANHGIGPVFGTAAAAASLLNLPKEHIGHVLTYCAQQASGSYQWLLDVEHIEKSFVFAGMGARNGLHAALMVEAGFRGVRGALDHSLGWLKSSIFSGRDANPDYLIDGLGHRTELHHTAYKRYPVGGPTQPAVQGILHLLPDIDRGALHSISISMPGRWQAFRDAAMPALNLRYLIAIILIDGRLDFFSAQSLERMHQDPEVKELMSRVDVVHDPAQESAPDEPRKESARIVVTHTDGTTLEHFVPHVVGFPSHPMSREEVERKAATLMEPSLGASRTKSVVRHINEILQLRDGSAIPKLIAV
jgi:2-methylcitrate dehydratase PrpD